MVMSARAIMAGKQTIGDFVLINALLMQLSMPLNFIGMIYREIVQGLADIEAMFRLLEVPPEVTDRPGAPPLVVARALSASRTCISHMTRRGDPERHQLRSPGQRYRRHRRPVRRRQSTISRLLFRFYDVSAGAS